MLFGIFQPLLCYDHSNWLRKFFAKERSFEGDKDDVLRILATLTEVPVGRKREDKDVKADPYPT